jgi:hypothetical protein
MSERGYPKLQNNYAACLDKTLSKYPLEAEIFAGINARQSIDQVFTTHPACVCLKVIFKSMSSYSQTR